MTAFFQYVSMIRREGLQEWIYKEIAVRTCVLLENVHVLFTCYHHDDVPIGHCCNRF